MRRLSFVAVSAAVLLSPVGSAWATPGVDHQSQTATPQAPEAAQPAAESEEKPWTAEEIADLERQAAAGNATAMYQLGLAYDYGDGVVEDRQKAVGWYQKASKLGHREAMNNLGSIYTKGKDGIPLNYAEALKLFRKAAALGNPVAMFNIAYAYDVGMGVPVNDVEAVKWYRQSAEAGYADAALSMGQMYTDGEGVVTSLPDAIAWYERAALSNDADVRKKAREALDTLTSPSVRKPYT